MDFSQIALFLTVAATAGVVAKLLRQPLLIGYLVAGIVLAFTGVISDGHSIESLAQIGVTLLLFLLGLEMNMVDLRSVGKVALITGLGQIIITSLLGYFIARLFGFTNISSVYIAVSLTFSSTIIMVKLLSEKKDLSSLYGKIAIGFLLVQDVVAVLILMFLGGVGGSGFGGLELAKVAIRAVVLFVGVWSLSKYVLPYLYERIVGASSELLFIVSIAWALGLASLIAGPFGFTLEIGGFVAGLALAGLPEHLQIESRTKPLRDFFLVLFFLLLGSKLIVDANIAVLLPKALVFSIFVLVGNPLIVLIILGLSGYKKRTSFMAGLTVAQISEFSFILMSMGYSLGHVTETDVALIVMVGVITMTLSSYMILGADAIFDKIHKKLSIFEKSITLEGAFLTQTKQLDHIVLVGCDRTGRRLTKYLRAKNKDFVVVDFNPSVFTKLTAEQTNIVFGDINDSEVFHSANVVESKMIISTINHLSENITLLNRIRNREIVTVFTASSYDDAIRLYESGATYVVVPEIVAGEHIRHLLSVYGTAHSKYLKLGKSNFDRMIFT